jgi:hypothetical protein
MTFIPDAFQRNRMGCRRKFRGQRKRIDGWGIWRREMRRMELMGRNKGLEKKGQINENKKYISHHKILEQLHARTRHLELLALPMAIINSIIRFRSTVIVNAEFLWNSQLIESLQKFPLTDNFSISK